MVQIAGCAERWNRIRYRSPEAWSEAAAALRAAAVSVAPAGTPWEWLEEECALAPRRSDVDQPARVGIRIDSFTLVVLDANDQLVKTKPLVGLTPIEASRFAQAHGIQVAEQGNETAIAPVSEETLTDIERWVNNAHSALSRFARATKGAKPVYIDGATLDVIARVTLPTRKDEAMREVVAGFSLAGAGDGQGPEVWVEASPVDGTSRRGTTLGEIASARDGDAQARSVEAFLQEALESAYAALHREWRPRDSHPPTP